MCGTHCDITTTRRAAPSELLATHASPLRRTGVSDESSHDVPVLDKHQTCYILLLAFSILLWEARIKGEGIPSGSRVTPRGGFAFAAIHAATVSPHQA